MPAYNPIIARHSLIKNRQGSVFMMTGMAILVLSAAMGSGLDFGRQQLVRIKLQQASDSAALAAATLGADATEQNRRDIALRYFAMNYPTSYLGVERPPVQITLGDSISVKANATVESMFISAAGVDSLDANANTVVTTGKSQSARSVYNDVTVLIDNSASMAGPIEGSQEQMLEASPPMGDRYKTAIMSCQRLPVQNGPLGSFGQAQGPDGRPLETLGNIFCRNLPGKGSPTLQKWEGYGLTGTNKLNAVRYAVAHFGLRLLATNTTDKQNRFNHEAQNYFGVESFNSTTYPGLIWSKSSGGIVQHSDAQSTAPLNYQTVNGNNALWELLTMQATGVAPDPNAFFTHLDPHGTISTFNKNKVLIIVTDGIDSCAPSITTPWLRATGESNEKNALPFYGYVLPDDVPALNDYGCKRGWSVGHGGSFYEVAASDSNSKFAIQKFRESLAKNNVSLHVILVGNDPLSATKSEAFWKQFATTDSKGRINLHRAISATELNESFSNILKQTQRIRIAQ